MNAKLIDYSKKMIISSTILELLDDIFEQKESFVDVLLQISSSELSSLLKLILDELISFSNYKEIIEKIEKRLGFDAMFILDLIKTIETVRADFIKTITNDIFLKSYLRVASYHNITEVKTSFKDEVTTIKEVSPNLIALQDILEKNGIKINTKEIKAILNTNINFDAWLKEIQTTK